MALGDVQKEFGFKKGEVTLKTTTGCTKGFLLCYDTDGYAHATRALYSTNITYRPVVALETVTAPGAGQAAAEVLEEGVVDILTSTSVCYEGQWMAISGTAGTVKLWSGFTTHASTWNDQASNLVSRMGYLMAGKAAKATFGTIRFLPQ